MTAFAEWYENLPTIEEIEVALDQCYDPGEWVEWNNRRPLAEAVVDRARIDRVREVFSTPADGGRARRLQIELEVAHDVLGDVLP